MDPFLRIRGRPASVMCCTRHLQATHGHMRVRHLRVARKSVANRTCMASAPHPAAQVASCSASCVPCAGAWGARGKNSPERMLQIAFGPVLQRKVAAQVYEQSPRSVRRVLVHVAHMAVRSQQTLLRHSFNQLSQLQRGLGCEGPPTWGAFFWMWDETTEMLVFEAARQAARSQSTSVHAMASVAVQACYNATVRTAAGECVPGASVVRSSGTHQTQVPSGRSGSGGCGSCNSDSDESSGSGAPRTPIGASASFGRCRRGSRPCRRRAADPDWCLLQLLSDC